MENSEVWKEIPKIYIQVNNMGIIRVGEKILKPIKHGKYLQVYSKRKYYIHRLVASAFHGLDLNNPKQLACHRDDDTSNNREDNIFVGTHKENTQDMMRKGREFKGDKRIVVQLGIDGKFIKEWESIKKVSMELKLDVTNICKCCKGKRYRSVGGFIWKYKENYI